MPGSHPSSLFSTFLLPALQLAGSSVWSGPRPDSNSSPTRCSLGQAAATEPEVRVGRPRDVILVWVRGFIVMDFASQKAEFERDMAAWLREGKMKYREDIVDGLENAVPAFRGLLQGQNFGKLLVRVARQG